jgi:5-methylcytosine-specific restriction endonuclease McrA
MKRTPLQRKTPLRSRTGLKRSRPMRKRSKPTTYTRELREWIRERDGGRCQLCGRPGHQVHHVIPRGRFYREWYTFTDVHDERNLMLVCFRCHNRIHSEPGVLEQAICIQEVRFGPLRKASVQPVDT